LVVTIVAGFPADWYRTNFSADASVLCPARPATRSRSSTSRRGA